MRVYRLFFPWWRTKSFIFGARNISLCINIFFPFNQSTPSFNKPWDPSGFIFPPLPLIFCLSSVFTCIFSLSCVYSVFLRPSFFLTFSRFFFPFFYSDDAISEFVSFCPSFLEPLLFILRVYFSCLLCLYPVLLPPSLFLPFLGCSSYFFTRTMEYLTCYLSASPCFSSLLFLLVNFPSLLWLYSVFLLLSFFPFYLLGQCSTWVFYIFFFFPLLFSASPLFLLVYFLYLLCPYFFLPPLFFLTFLGTSSHSFTRTMQ